MHIHWHVTVREAAAGRNRYMQCRCGARRIIHGIRNMPMDYNWLKTGTFSGYGFIPVQTSIPKAPPR